MSRMPRMPLLSGLNEEYDWGAIEDYECSVYDATDDDDNLSDEQFDECMRNVRAAYAEYYALYES